MSSVHTDPVKQQVAAHWDRRAAHFDEDFGHSIRTPAERAAWDRIFGLVLRSGGPLDALDLGCGTGFLSLELAARGHRVTGVDFAPSMIALAEAKAAERGLAVRFEQGDAEQLPYPPAGFDLAISRHVLWTLPHPEAAIDEWIRVLRPGGRLVVVDGAVLDGSDRSPARSRDARRMPGPARNMRRSATNCRSLAAGRGSRSKRCCARTASSNIGGDPLVDLVDAQVQAHDRGGAGAAAAKPLRRLGRRSALSFRCSKAAAEWGATSTASPDMPRRARAFALAKSSPPSAANSMPGRAVAHCGPASTPSERRSAPRASRDAPDPASNPVSGCGRPAFAFR